MIPSLAALHCLTVFISPVQRCFLKPNNLGSTLAALCSFQLHQAPSFYTKISFKPTALWRLCTTILQAGSASREPYSSWQPNRPAFSPERRMEINPEWTRENTRLKFPLMSRNMTGMHRCSAAAARFDKFFIFYRWESVSSTVCLLPLSWAGGGGG